MRRTVTPRALTVALAIAAVALCSLAARAQDVAIINTRVIVGNGTVIAPAAIVVRAGKIVSVSAGAANTQGLKTIDAKGMSAMPGFIDGHKHINTGPNEKQEMQALLEAGYTTILSGGGPAEGNLTLRDHIEKGLINGPRIIPSMPIGMPGGDRSRNPLTDMTPESAREQIRKMAARGIKWTGEFRFTTDQKDTFPPQHEMEVVKALVDEGKKVGVTVQMHTISSASMEAGMEAGVRRFVHLILVDWLPAARAKRIADSGAIVLGTIGYGAPVINVFTKDNTPKFRDGQPWPKNISAHTLLDGVEVGQEAGFAIVNARTFWDAGGILGYSTDTNYDALAGLEHELKSYNVVFSSQDIVKILGPHTASYLNMGDQLGTIEPGRLADIILLDGNPMEGIHNMLRAKVVFKGGVVVVDKR